MIGNQIQPGHDRLVNFDIENFEALRDYLTKRGSVKPGEEVSLTKLLGGVSNRTVKVAWSDGRAWVLKQALEKLRVNEDWFSNPARIGVEAKALRYLNRLVPPGMTPAFIFEDTPNYLMGMEAIPEDHENWKSILLGGRIDSDHFEQFGLLLGAIHRRSSDPDFKPELSKGFANRTHFESLRLEPYYLFTAHKLPIAAEFLRSLTQETLFHRDCLVHGDFSPKNTLVHRGKLILLDYEVVHFGDPTFDVGFALTHFLSKAHHLPKQRARLFSAAGLFWQVYREGTERAEWASTLEPRAVRHSLGCLLARVAGKSQLEYLTPQEAARQQEVVLSLLDSPPTSVADLITEFARKIEAYAEN